MLLFAVVLWRAHGRWLAIGYRGAAAGDFFLDFGERDGLFSQALLSLLVSQVAFLVTFVLLGRGQPWPRLNAAGPLEAPVAVYLASLVAMVLPAWRLQDRPGALWLGAMLADSLIGLDKFVMPLCPGQRDHRHLLFHRPGADRLGATKPCRCFRRCRCSCRPQAWVRSRARGWLKASEWSACLMGVPAANSIS